MAKTKENKVSKKENKRVEDLKEKGKSLIEDYDPELLEGEVELVIPEGLTKDLKKEIANVNNASMQEIRYLVDNYYQVQNKRIALQGQIRALRQEADVTGSNAFVDILEWQLKCQKIQEDGIKKALECICKTSEVGRWLMSIKAIGPVTAAGLLAYFNVEGINYATHFMSYAGLNDNNRPWLGAEKSKKIVEEVLGKSKTITNDHLTKISARTQWKYEYLDKVCSKYDDKGNLKSRSKTDLIKACSKIPYNKNLKVLMFKIGESFVKNANRGSLYGQLYQQRKALEIKLNDEGHYKDQAKAILESKNLGKETDAYKAYSKGKLPDAHIHRRAVRWATKIFVSHVFEEMYRVHNNEKPESYYVFSHQGHKDYIGPEVKFTRLD